MQPNRQPVRLKVATVARDAGSGHGGAEKVAFEYARRLDPSRFESWLCTTARPAPVRVPSFERDRRDLADQGVHTLDLDRRSTADVVPWTRLLGLLRRERIDIVHAHMPRASVPAALLARIARVPVIISHEHGSLLGGKVIRPLVDRAVVGTLSTRIVAVSEWDRQQLIERERMPSDRVSVLPNGIEPLPAAEPAPLRAELGMGPQCALIGAVGRLYSQKDYPNLVEACSHLRRAGVSFVCVIVGDGPDEAALRALIEQRGLQAHVRLIGRRSDIPAVLGALDIAVISSRWEGSPLALLEYMAAGKAIVSTSVGGVPEMIGDDREGLLVPPSDPAALALAMQRLAQDPGLAARLGLAAQQRQRERYDLEAIIRTLEDLYRSLYDAAGTHRSRTPVRPPRH